MGLSGSPTGLEGDTGNANDVGGHMELDGGAGNANDGGGLMELEGGAGDTRAERSADRWTGGVC